MNKGKAYLPEINAYQKYFNNKTNFYFYDSSILKDFKLEDFDVIWHFMGFDTHKTKIFTVHEYASLSTDPFPKIKNFIKKQVNVKPDLRIFLNEYIKEGFDFKDNIPCCLRDMGVDESFFVNEPNKKYDFVYIGEITKKRKIHVLLNKFKTDFKDFKILMLGKPEKDIYDEFKSSQNIYFTGKVNYYDVAKLAKEAMYGINFVPNIYPYNLQTSTKILEYCAMNLKIITLSYNWVNSFEKKYNAKFLYIKDDMSDFDFDKIKNFDYKIPNVEELKWENIIRKSGIEKKLIISN